MKKLSGLKDLLHVLPIIVITAIINMLIGITSAVSIMIMMQDTYQNSDLSLASGVLAAVLIAFWITYNHKLTLFIKGNIHE